MSYRPHVSNDPKTLKSGAVTTSYVASSNVQMKGWNTAVIHVDADLDVAGGTTGLQLFVEIANPQGDAEPAAADWHGLVAEGAAVASAGFVTLPAGVKVWDFGAADARYAITIDRLAAKFLRVQAKVAGAAGTSTCTIKCAQALT